MPNEADQWLDWNVYDATKDAKQLKGDKSPGFAPYDAMYNDSFTYANGGSDPLGYQGHRADFDAKNRQAELAAGYVGNGPTAAANQLQAGVDQYQVAASGAANTRGSNMLAQRQAMYGGGQARAQANTQGKALAANEYAQGAALQIGVQQNQQSNYAGMATGNQSRYTNRHKDVQDKLLNEQAIQMGLDRESRESNKAAANAFLQGAGTAIGNGAVQANNNPQDDDDTPSDERVKRSAYEAGKADERRLFAELDAEGRRTEDAFMHPDQKAARVGAELDAEGAKLDETMRGLKLNKFEYKPETGLPQGMRYGVMAQDVEKTPYGPEVVGEQNGVKTLGDDASIGLGKKMTMRIEDRIKMLEEELAIEGERFEKEWRYGGR